MEDEKGRGSFQNPTRTSRTTWLQEEASEELRSVYHRLDRLMRAENLFRESLQVIHYRVGEHYHSHHDGHKRFATAFIYLNEGFEGGETYFPAVSGVGGTRLPDWRTRLRCEGGFRAIGRTGDVVLWYNEALKWNDTTGTWATQEALEAIHAGCDVRAGEKWGANLWYRFRRD